MALDHSQRMRLLQFVCTFAWTDLKVSQAERDVVMRLCGRWGLDAADTKRVQGWLQVPPPIDEVDPTTIPREHRKLFLEAAELIVRADQRIDPREIETLAIFRDLLK